MGHRSFALAGGGARVALIVPGDRRRTARLAARRAAQVPATVAQVPPG